MEKHPYRPHFRDLNDIELVFLFQQRYSNWTENVTKGENASGQWNDLRHMGEILEELKHRKVGDMDMNDSLYESEKKKSQDLWDQLSSGPGVH